ncbi:hypothetical protein PR048_013314 [Dryococelus australis]|uniref:PiggyBac transposable element-derived protein domain-containing protein n=1 Tax=Dryococelus australis TaxID=614101 RepID=A0ABQ9HRU0_9NEOP|nr:hypothetical protein PR048_013314 [Dryococelus australis]
MNTNYNEMKDFLAIHLYIGIIKLPCYVDYWSEQFRVEKVAGIMSLKRYQTLCKYHHFNDNAMANDDLYYKIVKKNCNAIPNEKQQLIDEKMVPFKGTCAGSRKKYIKLKPKNWGFKIFVRAGSSGIVYDFVVYGGPDTFRQHQFSNNEEIMGLGSKVVLDLCQTISNPALTTVYFDNFFTSLELLCHLHQEYSILALGTIRNVPCPNTVKKYDVHIGRVNVADMLIALYRTPFKPKKCYLTIFGHLLDLCVINAWLLNRREAALMKEKYNDGLKILDRLASAGAPTSVNTKLIKHPSAPHPVMEVRLDKYDHFSICAEKVRCRHCKAGQSRIKCIKCNMTLCLIPVHNCFYEFHHQ